MKTGASAKAIVGRTTAAPATPARTWLLDHEGVAAGDRLAFEVAAGRRLGKRDTRTVRLFGLGVVVLLVGQRG